MSYAFALRSDNYICNSYAGVIYTSRHRHTQMHTHLEGHLAALAVPLHLLLLGRRCPCGPSCWQMWCACVGLLCQTLPQTEPGPPDQAEPSWALQEVWACHSSYLKKAKQQPRFIHFLIIETACPWCILNCSKIWQAKHITQFIMFTDPPVMLWVKLTRFNI